MAAEKISCNLYTSAHKGWRWFTPSRRNNKNALFLFSNSKCVWPQVYCTVWGHLYLLSHSMPPIQNPPMFIFPFLFIFFFIIHSFASLPVNTKMNEKAGKRTGLQKRFMTLGSHGKGNLLEREPESAVWCHILQGKSEERWGMIHLQAAADNWAVSNMTAGSGSNKISNRAWRRWR